MSYASSPSPQQIRELVELFNRGRLREALQQGEALTRQFPSSPLVQNVLGAVNAGLGRFEQSVSSFSRAVEIEPDYAEAHNNLGNALNRLGRHEAAIASYRKALQIQPKFAEAHNNLGNARSALGQEAEAVSSFSRALEIKPDYAEASYNLGNALRKLGRLEEAISSFGRALQIRPGFAEAHRNLGNALNDLGRPGDAITCYNRALEIKPDYAEAHYNLANVLSDLGELEAAVRSYETAIEIDPAHAEAHNNLGNVLADLRRPDAAVASYRRAIEIDPDSAEPHNNLGNVLRDLGSPEEAVASYDRAIEIRPDYSEAYSNRGNALKDLGRLEEAVESYETALAIDPSCAEAHNALGNVSRDHLRRPEEAVARYDRAIEIDPEYAEAHNNRGNALKNLGRLEEAVASYERALELDPAYAQAHRNLSTARQYHEGDSQMGQMHELLERQDLSDEERMHLNFALGKAYGDTGDYDRAFSHLSEGNRLRRRELSYDAAAVRDLFARIQSAFSKDLAVPDVSEAARSEGQRPIFVLGMPRSGTSLVEQILASHSRVHGAGELDVLDRAVRSSGWSSGELSSRHLHSIRDSYFSALRKIGVASPYLIDKNPLNFRWIGFILAALPEAKIVHVRRDARATCWSNFRHCFSGEAIGFAYDLQDIAEYYGMYRDLMAFWHAEAPGRIYDLSYETLTEHQEPETRKLLEHVGLDWEDQCLDFHATRRAVQTASDMQVRQRMYRGSSNEWRKYEKHLEPMVEALSGF